MTHVCIQPWVVLKLTQPLLFKCARQWNQSGDVVFVVSLPQENCLTAQSIFLLMTGLFCNGTADSSIAGPRSQLNHSLQPSWRMDSVDSVQGGWIHSARTLIYTRFTDIYCRRRVGCGIWAKLGEITIQLGSIYVLFLSKTAAKYGFPLALPI